ncbi:hypothetical protein CDAR_534521 [Caerostris darwini]|uniref:Uncharacterized protein n=1 Tax=Caerostris darwini TaxID=1538125 RepID=A0AAV4MJ98_9ARAC|nr:hypothetical protein CDAR_534521 [Caerostris darwini]
MITPMCIVCCTPPNSWGGLGCSCCSTPSLSCPFLSVHSLCARKPRVLISSLFRVSVICIRDFPSPRNVITHTVKGILCHWITSECSRNMLLGRVTSNKMDMKYAS